MSSVIHLDTETLRKYEKITDAERKVRSASDPEYLKEVMDYYLNGTKLNGIKLPDCLGGNSILKDKFRFAAGELTVLAGINVLASPCWLVRSCCRQQSRGSGVCLSRWRCHHECSWRG